ncbi:MAG: hypothetical protein MR503_01795 [Oscillospiraceae bacterium]|nr:hypothetical protein [Oscillospiraceae bacterium]
MFPSNCKAILKTLDDSIVEYGQAAVSLKEKYAEFSSQFVPLLKIGTEAKIICVEGNTSTHIISGEVYLSSKNLLRLVSIKCTLIPGAENVLETPAFLRAKIYKPVMKKGIFSKNKIVYKWDECTITSLSMKNISFRSSRIMCEYEDQIKLRIGAPVFSRDTEINLQIASNGLMFGKNSKYNYKILKLKEREQKELADFIKLGNLEMIKYLH